MGLTRPQRSWLFALFLVLALASAALESYVIVRMIELKELTALHGVVGVLNGGGLAYLMKVFVEILRREYLTRDFVSERHLSSYFSDRLETFTRAGNLVVADGVERLNLHLTRSNLKLLEEILRDWYGDHRFQLSVFANHEHPEIVCYWDTSGHLVPRSHGERLADPDYYRKHKYAVVEVLENRTTDLLIIPDTRKEDASYSFVNWEQKNNIGSTLLFRFASDQPGALVLACDEGEVFDQSDVRLRSLVSALGAAVRSEWELRSRLRELTARL